MTINEYLKALRESRGLSQRGLAIKMGVSNSTISQIENNRNKPSIDILFLYEKALNADLSTMISLMEREAREHEYAGSDFYEIDIAMQIPLVGTVKAGIPILATDNIEDYIRVDKDKMSKEKIYYALRIKGDSMDKLFPEGTIIVVEKTDVIDNNQIAVVGINGNEATVKRVAFADDNIALIPESNNPAYVTQILFLPDSDIHILGRVVQAIRYF